VAKIKRGGKLSYAAPWTYPTLDPHLSSLTTAALFFLTNDPLIDYTLKNKETHQWEFTPRLATSWEQTDPKTLVFKLRQGVKFHDGSNFNAEVAKWNLDRAMKNSKSYVKSAFETVDGVDVVDTSTIRLRLKVPSAGILAQLRQNASMMVSRSAVEQLGEDEFGRRPVGSGPMQYVEWAKDDFVRVKKFPGYWEIGEDGQPLPYLEEATIYFRPDTTVMVLDLRAGKLDIAEYIEPKDVASVTADQNLTTDMYYPAGRMMFVFGINQQKEPFGKNPKLRQALQHSIDRESMAKALGFGLAKAQYYPQMAEGLLGFTPDLPKYPYDAVKAKQLLSEGGYPNGLETTLLVINRSAEVRISEMVKSMWDNVGIRTTLEVLERLAWIDKMKNMGFDVGFWGGARPVDTDELSKAFGCGAPSNWSSYCNKDFDTCMEQGRNTYKTEERDKIYRRCLTMVMEDAFLGAGIANPNIWGMNKRVQGFTYQWSTADIHKVWLK
jgi:ABC-type transport system substrate-binding protein